MTESKSHLLLQHYLKQLKLPTILREYAAVAAGCTKDRCDCINFLLRLVEREALDRYQRATERRIKNARFPVIKTLDTCPSPRRGRNCSLRWSPAALLLRPSQPIPGVTLQQELLHFATVPPLRKKLGQA